jgi:branched-chain amino acid transport system permease protein
VNVSYLVDTLVQCLFLVCLATSLNLLMGYAGQFSMATAGFYAVGAYTYVFMSSTVNGSLTRPQILGPGWPFLPSLLVAMAASFVVGVGVSWPAARRVKGEHIILLTMAFMYVVTQTAMSVVGITGGPQGLRVEPIHIGGMVFSSPNKGIILVGAMTVVVIALAWLVGKWGFGRVLRGIRDDEEVLQSLGKKTVISKSIAFGLSAAMAGGIGAIGVGYLMFVAPGTYTLELSILAAGAVALGGPGNILGVTIAAIVLAAIGPILTNVGLTSTSGNLWQYIIFGALLIIGVRFRAKGLIPEGARLFRRRGRPRAGVSVEPDADVNSDEVLG